MKKTYINPEIEIIKIQTTQMLAASLPLNDEVQVTDPTEILAPGIPGMGGMPDLPPLVNLPGFTE